MDMFLSKTKSEKDLEETAVEISSLVDPDPPCITRKMGLSRSDPIFSLVYNWWLRSFSGERLTLPGLYTPCTLPKAAAMENMGPILDNSS